MGSPDVVNSVAQNFTVSRRERRLVLRLRQLEGQDVDQVVLRLRGGWRIVEKTDTREERLEDAAVLTQES